MSDEDEKEIGEEIQAKCFKIPPSKVTEEDLKSFHSSDYVDFLKRLQESEDPEALIELEGEGHEHFGIGKALFT